MLGFHLYIYIQERYFQVKSTKMDRDTGPENKMGQCGLVTQPDNGPAENRLDKG